MMNKHCSKCDGSGFLIEYAGIKNGVCFQCGGKKTRTTEELKEYRKEQKERRKESDERAKIRYEYPLKIKNAKKFLEKFDLDTPFESEEEEKEFMGFIERRRKQIERMEKELAAANEFVIHQKDVKEKDYY